MRKFLIRCLILIVATFFLAIQTVSAASEPVIQIDSGKIRGTVENGVACFKGIPYAAPPVGNLRWQPPKAPESWNGIRDAKIYAEQAIQNAELGVFANSGGSEDCLYLNVFVSEKNLTADKKLPVFFWIHGGGLFVGSASDYNPIPLAKIGNAVVVTINYRLGAFGFFSHPAIDSEGHAFANYGLMDQIFALDWVVKNISQFGGDPKNITIAGESSGGQSVLAFMTSPKTKGKFQAAIGMSACTVTLHSNFTSYTIDVAEKIGVQLAKDAGLENATAEQLRNLPAETILKHQKPFGTFTIDGEFVPEHIGDALQAGHVHEIVFVNGTTRNEGSFFVGLQENFTGEVMTAENYAKNVKEFAASFEDDISDKILAEYPLEDYATPSNAYAAIVTDSWFAYTADKVNRALCDKIPVYAYEFDDQTAPNYLETSFKQGAAHTYEIPYIFEGFNGSSELSTKLNPAQEKLSREMMILWTHALDLKKNKLWKPYDVRSGNYLRLSLPNPVMFEKEFAKTHHVGFWDSVLK